MAIKDANDMRVKNLSELGKLVANATVSHIPAEAGPDIEIRDSVLEPVVSQRVTKTTHPIQPVRESENTMSNQSTQPIINNNTQPAEVIVNANTQPVQPTQTSQPSEPKMNAQPTQTIETKEPVVNAQATTSTQETPKPNLGKALRGEAPSTQVLEDLLISEPQTDMDVRFNTLVDQTMGLNFELQKLKKKSITVTYQNDNIAKEVGKAIVAGAGAGLLTFGVIKLATLAYEKIAGDQVTE